MKEIQIIVTVIMLGGSSGCIPFKLQETPYVAGRVVDEAAKKPIAGAKLCYANYPKLFKHTSEEGRFELRPIFRWHLVPLLGAYDRFYRQTLVIESPNYETAKINVGHDGVEDFRTVYLKPK